MTIALVDVPRCLKVHASYVGAPRALAASGSRRPRAWAEAMPWTGTEAYRKQAVKECLDTVAVLRSYREPLEGETWLTPAASERRLLAQLNAIIALGPPALQQAIALSLDADVPDPGRVFAGLLVVGCVEGRDWLDPARDLFVATVLRGAAEAAAAVEAVSLAPGPELASFLVDLLGHERPQVRAGAVRALAFRGALSEASWHNAMRDGDPTVVAAALSAPLGAYDRTACERVLQPLIARRDAESLVRQALRAGLGLGLDTAHDSAVQIVRDHPSFADAARCLAMFGDVGDARHFRGALGGPGVRDGVRAAAILGSIELVPDLLELLDRTDSPPELGVAAKHALATITGLPFVATADVSQALGLWSLHSQGFERHGRYRHGQPLSLEVLLQSLRTGPAARKARQNIYLEMQAATESRVPRFSPYDFAGVQIQSLRRIEQWLADPQARRSTASNRH